VSHQHDGTSFIKASILTGVFACRSPVRPNLIAMSLCRVISIEGGAIEIEGIDGVDQITGTFSWTFDPGDFENGVW
jgi:tRNA (Thr-GGU) A37 N-methylase